MSRKGTLTVPCYYRGCIIFIISCHGSSAVSLLRSGMSQLSAGSVGIPVQFIRYIFAEKFLSEISPTPRSVRQSASGMVLVYIKINQLPSTKL